MTEVLTRYRVAAAWALFALALSATAQPQPSAAASRPAAQGQRADPTDARAEVPRLVYRSPMQGYRPYADAEPASWVDTNGNVGRIGGWRAYAREAHQPDAAASAARPAASAPLPAGHAGHKTH